MNKPLFFILFTILAGVCLHTEVNIHTELITEEEEAAAALSFRLQLKYEAPVGI